MNRIVIDPQLAEKLAAATGGVELCAPSGVILGYFTPRPDPSIYEGLEPPISEEELDRRSQEGGGRPLKDILDDLERRE